MEKKKILIVGFGTIGCRHVQSFMYDKKDYEVHIVEPNNKNIKDNLKKINGEKEDFIWYKNINQIPVLDIAIVATSSAPRFEIVKSLINIGYRKFLLEKIVFQSEEQFKIINEMIEKTNSIVYCNFVNRYFKPYNDIKNELSKSKDKININIHGGNFGLGCNAIHYIDIFQYIINDNIIKIDSSNLYLSEVKNKRGSIYKEFNGIIKLSNKKSDSITLISEPDYNGDLTISINQNDKFYFLNENIGKYYIFDTSKSIVEDFYLIPSSELTKIIIEDIFKENCRLTTLNETMVSHTSLFKAFNNVIFNNEKNIKEILCPIT